MTLTFADVDRWDPDQISEVFRICTGHRAACDDVARPLKSPALFSAWGGDAAAAAEDSADKIRRDLDAHGHEIAGVARAVRQAHADVVALKADLASLRTDIAAHRLALEDDGSVTDFRVSPGAETAGDVVGPLIRRAGALLSRAERIDDDLAAAIDAADGDLSIRGDGRNVERQTNQRNAFRRVYKRDPVSDNDWRLAEGLDTHTYDGESEGSPAVVRVGRIRPVPGAGVVRMNLYIPAEEVVNVETSGIPGRVPNAGDHRGPSATADAEDSRVSVYVDYETGIVFVRQNPTVERETDRRPRAGIPEVRVGQDRNGAVKIVYDAKDSFQPALADQVDIGVQGSITVDPSTAIPSVGGQVTPYPAIEIYHHSPEGTTTELFERNVNGSPYGPMTQLLRRATEHIGSEDVPHVGPVPDTERYTGRVRERFGTELGAPDDPPVVRVY